MDSTNQRPMTFGEQLVGITFNESNDDRITIAKHLCAELADLLNNYNEAKETKTQKQLVCYHH